MKKLIILGVLVVITYFGYGYFVNSQMYKLNAENTMNKYDYVFPGGIKQIDESYIADNKFYNVRIIYFNNEDEAGQGITKMKEQYNPGMIGIGGKYVNHKEGSLSNHMYFYKSEEKIVYISNFLGEKDMGDNFIKWYYSKYPNQ